MPRIELLGGGFKYFLCSPLLGEDSHVDQYFPNGRFNHQLDEGTKVFSGRMVLLMEEILHQLILRISDIPCFIGFQWISYITGGAGFLPSTVWMNLTSSSKIWCVRLGNTGNTLQFQVVLFQ